ncbi:MAG: hypothetical protein ABIZ56_06630, partial [Chthoniobacteraceae bacterium]
MALAPIEVDPHNPATGTAASKDAVVAIDSGAPSGSVQALPAANTLTLTLSSAVDQSILSVALNLKTGMEIPNVSE